MKHLPGDQVQKGSGVLVKAKEEILNDWKREEGNDETSPWRPSAEGIRSSCESEGGDFERLEERSCKDGEGNSQQAQRSGNNQSQGRRNSVRWHPEEGRC